MTTHATRRSALLLALLAATLAPPAAAQEPTPAPIALSDPDGQELVIEELNVRAAVQGGQMANHVRSARPAPAAG